MVVVTHTVDVWRGSDEMEARLEEGESEGEGSDGEAEAKPSRRKGDKQVRRTTPPCASATLGVFPE